MYLLKGWTGGPSRCAAAGVRAQVQFATKAALARQLITTAVQAGVPCTPVGR